MNEMDHRLESIKLLTRGVKLPLPAVNDEHMMIIANAIHDAYVWACESFSNIESEDSSSEDMVTSRVQAYLNNLIDEGSIVGNYISCIARNESIEKFDGSSINKSPDLTIRTCDSNRVGLPITVEAKIIDKPNNKTVSLYYNSGVERFIQGDYAWYSKESFMVAYVRDGSTTETVLKPYLNSKYANHHRILPNPNLKVKGDLAIVEHQRTFVYKHSTHTKPGSIFIWHLWV